MIILPEIRIYDLVKGLVLHIKKDHEANSANTNLSMLHYIFGSLKNVKKSYYKDAVSLFTRGNTSPRKIKTRLYYDGETAKSPTIHITVPQEQQDQGTIGEGDGFSQIGDPSEGGLLTYRETVSKRYNAVTHIILTSDNESEVILMYHALRAMIQSAIESFALIGLENVKIGGQEIQQNEGLAIDIYHRGISLSYTYCIEVPKWYDQESLTELLMCKYEQDPDLAPKILSNE